MLTQSSPHDGVAALAVPALSAPTMPTPPTRVSVAAVARALLLIDMNDFSLYYSRALRTTVTLGRSLLDVSSSIQRVTLVRTPITWRWLSHTHSKFAADR